MGKKTPPGDVRMGAIVLRLKLVLQLHRQGQVRSDSQGRFLQVLPKGVFSHPHFVFTYMNFVDLYGKLVGNGEYISHMDAMRWEPLWVS